MAFSAQMLDFLTENVLHNDREWYKEHREDCRRLVDRPLADFAARVNGYIVKTDPLIDKVHISRIFRDARILRGRPFFRENMWVSFGREKDLYKSLPAFYFDISPNGAEYGCGYYVPPADAMNNMRMMIKAGNPQYIKAKECLSRCPSFSLYGDMYKKSKFPDSPEEDRQWLDRKTIGVFARSEDWELIFSEDYADFVGKELSGLADFYTFILGAALMSLKDSYK